MLAQSSRSLYSIVRDSSVKKGFLNHAFFAMTTILKESVWDSIVEIYLRP